MKDEKTYSTLCCEYCKYCKLTLIEDEEWGAEYLYKCGESIVLPQAKCKNWEKKCDK